MPLLIGDCLNYASRIGAAGEGNRCLVGPRAATMRDLGPFGLSGPYTISGKAHESAYEYWSLDLGEIWREIKGGSTGTETYWG